MMKVSRVVARGMAMLAVLACLPALALAQTAANSGQIVGQIADSTGAAIVGAEVNLSCW